MFGIWPSCNIYASFKWCCLFGVSRFVNLKSESHFLYRTATGKLVDSRSIESRLCFKCVTRFAIEHFLEQDQQIHNGFFKTFFWD